MPRSVRDSDEETDVKTGRKIRSVAGLGSVDSPLRRSSRVKTAVKHYESSPESPLSDVSSVSNTQLTRITRRRTGTMDSLTITERSRPLRSRRSSVASDISDVIEIDTVVVSPTKRTKSIVTSDTFNKSNSRTSKRLTRAGSEAKSPTTSRVKRRTRASSTGPDTIPENKFTEINQIELDTSIKIKRQASILPSEATVLEETEEIMKDSVVTVDRTLPNVQELNEIDENSGQKQTNKLLSVSIVKLNYENIGKKTTDDMCAVEEAYDNPAENPSSTFEVEMDVLDDNKKQMSTGNENVLEHSENVLEQRENVLGQSENLSTNTVIQAESLEHNVSEMLLQSTNSDTSKEPGLKVENVLNNSIKEQVENLNNKENQATNIISDSQSKDDIISNVLLQSAKPLFISNINASKLTKEKCKSPNIETAIYRQSKELSELTSDVIVSVKETSNNSDTTNNSTNTNVMATSVKEKDPETSDNMQKLEISTDTGSLSETPLSEAANKSTEYIEICEDSSYSESIQIIECTEDTSKTDNEIGNQPKKSTEISLDDQKSNEDANIKMDVSSLHVEENINTNEEFEKDSIGQIMVKDDKCETIEKIAESDMSENMETDALNSIETVSHSDLNNATLSISSNGSLIESKCSITLKDENTTNNLQNIEETNNLLVHASTTQESSKDSISTDKNKNNATNMVKSSHSPIVTEIPAEPVKEVFKKEELLQKTSILGDSLTTEKQSVHKSELSNEQKKAEVNLETCKKNSEGIEVDDIDSDTNTANLFQDISAEEWKEKNNDVDQISVRSSMSTEVVDNESEIECDLILVDREAWLAAENIKMEKEKETFDYDSDDTVLLKAQRDSLKMNDEKTVNVLKDDCKMGVNRSKTSNINKRKSMQQEETADSEHGMEGSENAKDMTQDTEEAKDTGNISERKTIIKVTKEQNTPKSNTSIRKSVEEKSISESHETIEMNEDLSKLSADSPLNKSKLSEDVPKKRKSLNKSIQEMDNEPEKSNEMEMAKEKKSLNKSKSLEIEIIESDSNNEDVYTTIKKNKKKRSSHDFSKKKIKPKQIDVNLSEESGNESKESEVFEKKNRGTKKKFSRNRFTVNDTDSDSDVSKQNLDSDDSQNESVKLPKFLFGGESDDSDDDNKSNKSIDSDIQREYNLYGEDISKFSDDDVPGDECRASETESSDPDDNGSDLIDFVVDDDEVEEEIEEEEEEVEEEENEELDNDEDPEENEKQDKEALEEQDEEVLVEQDGKVSEEKDGKVSEDQDGKVSEEQDEEALEEQDVEALEEQDEKALEERDEETEQEMIEIEDKVQTKVTEEEDNSSNEQEIIDEKGTNKSMDNSNKEKNKLRKSVDTSLSKTIESGKKEKRRSKMDMNQIETDEHYLSSSPLSDSFKTKKTNLKRVLNEFSDNTEQLLSDSQLFAKKLHKLNKSLECSTPKSNSLKKEKFNTSLETTCVKLTNKTCEVEEDVYSNKEKVENRTLGMENSLKKISKEKSKDNFMCRSFPSKLIESVEKTNLSRPMSSKVTELNKSVLTPNIESPTIKYLNKEKLNESAPELKFSNKIIKSINNSVNNEQSRTSSSFEKVNVGIEESNVEATREINPSLRKKILKVADTILENDRKKKRKKRKQPIVAKTNFILFDEDNSKENKDSQIMEKTESHVVSDPNIDENDEAEILSNEKTQKRKKKKAISIEEPLKEDTCEDFKEIKVEINDSPIYNEGKKKKKRQKIIEDVTECTNTNLENKISTKKKGKNEKKILLPSQQISAEKLPKKKQKLLKDIASEGEQILIEKLPKKKKLLNDIASQDVQFLPEKLPKKKQKLLKDVAPEGEQILIEKLPKKKKKLSNDIASHDVLISTEKLPRKKQKLLKDDASEGENVFIEKLSKKKKKKKLLNNVVSQDVQFSAEKLPKKKQKLIKDAASEGEQILIQKLPKKRKKLSNDIASQNVPISTEKLSKNKQKLLPKDLQCAEATLEKLPKKMQKLLSQNVPRDKGKFSGTSNKSLQLSNAECDSHEEAEMVAFSKSRDKALDVLKHTIDSIKVNKELKKKQRREHIKKMQEGKEIEIRELKSKNQTTKSNKMDVPKRNIKRLPDEVLENLSDIPLKQLKKRKLLKSQEEVLPMRSMFDSKVKKSKSVDEENFIPLSSYGGTTQFSVVDLQKLKKKKMVLEVVAFRQKILARNSRQPTSAYLTYLEKLKASAKTTFYNKPY